MKPPLVSIVIATYDSSHLLRHALASLALSDFDDWEAIVVGDHCTDDSEECVASFRDPRMRFVNLEQNSGQQATPNNVGVSLARGEYLCFLNHDDLFMSHHLRTNLDCIRRSGADIVCSTNAVIPAPESGEGADEPSIRAVAGGYESTGQFSPRTFHVASSWFLRRATVDDVGPWRLEHQTFVTPSQDWLFRAWRHGKRIHITDEVSVVVIHSGARKDSYRKKTSPEHDLVFEHVIATDALREEMLAGVRSTMRKPPPAHRRKLHKRLRRRLRRSRDWALARCGIHPRTPTMIRLHGGRGGYIAALKRTTG